MNEVMNEFGEFKARIDALIVNHQTTGLTSITMYTPITLGAQGVPIFASPTIGQLNYEPSGTSNSSRMSIEFTYDTGTSVVTVNNSGGGKMELYAPNRYYVQQWVAYEGGALMIRQTDGQSMRALPSIDVSKMANGRVNLTFAQMDFLGLNSSYSGTGSVGVTVKLEYLDSQFYSSTQIQGQVRITLDTLYNSSWMSYFQNICSNAGLVNGASGNYTLTDTKVSDQVHRIVFTILDCGAMVYNRAYISTTLKY